MEIVTLDEIKLQLDIESGNVEYDELIGEIADSVESFIVNYTNTDFVSGDVSGVIVNENQSKTIYLPESQINTISVIGTDLDFNNNTYSEEQTVGVDVLLGNAGDLYNVDGYFPEMIYVEYNKGYDRPADIKQTIIDSVRLKFRHITDNADLIASKSVGGETTSYNLSDFSPTGLKVLNKYKGKAISITNNAWPMYNKVMTKA